MIANFLANNPYFWAVMAAIWQTTELYLGVKKPMDAGSVPQLLYKFLQHIFTKKKTPTTGDTTMTSTSANPNIRHLDVVVDGPTYDALGVVVALVKGVAAGQKPQEAVAAALPQILASFTQLSQIPGDLALDRASVLEAVSQRMGDLAEAFILAKTAAPVPPPALAPAK